MTIIDLIGSTALHIVSGSVSRLTSRDLEKMLGELFSVNKHLIRKTIKKLIADRLLTYTYTLGCSFLEISFNRPVRVSKRIIIKPAGMYCEQKPGSTVIEIVRGAAFGAGDHPTTRLAINAIDYSLSDFAFLKGGNALDIGTGSGILAMAAVALGINRAVGIDTDSCARWEAEFNIKINKMSDKIKIINQNLSMVKDRFSLIMANLRTPTLMALCPLVSKLNKKDGVLVLSGLRADETCDIIMCYRKNNYRCVWEQNEKDWAGLILVRGSATALSQPFTAGMT